MWPIHGVGRGTDNASSASNICERIGARYRFMRAAAALMARSLVFPVFSRIFASVTLGPNCGIGIFRFLLSVLPCFSEILPSRSRWRPSSPGSFMAIRVLCQGWQHYTAPLPCRHCTKPSEAGVASRGAPPGCGARIRICRSARGGRRIRRRARPTSSIFQLRHSTGSMLVMWHTGTAIPTNAWFRMGKL